MRLVPRGIGRGQLLVPASIFLTASLAFGNVVANFEPDKSYPESAGVFTLAGGGGGSAQLMIVNTGPNSITTGTVFYLFSPVGNDTQYDAIGQPFDMGTCDSKFMLVGVANQCVVKALFDVLDHDPFDTLNPPVDSGKWFIEAHIPWTDNITGATGTALAGINITITDDPVPEPASTLLVAAACLALIASRLERGRNKAS